MYCFFFAHICQLANVGKHYFNHTQRPLNPAKQGFFHIKNFQKTAKPIGKHWQTITAILLNFAL